MCHNVPAPRVAVSFQVLRCHLRYPGVAFHLQTCQAVSNTTPWRHLSDVLSVIACLGVTYLSRLLTAMSPFISRPAPVCSMPVVSCLVVASFTMRCQLIYHLVAPHLSSSHVMTPPLFFRFILHPAGSFVFCPLVMRPLFISPVMALRLNLARRHVFAHIWSCCDVSFQFSWWLLVSGHVRDRPLHPELH